VAFGAATEALGAAEAAGKACLAGAGGGALGIAAASLSGERPAAQAIASSTAPSARDGPEREGFRSSPRGIDAQGVPLGNACGALTSIAVPPRDR
jgi:hypothetical protein